MRKENIETDWKNFANIIDADVKIFHEKLKGKYHPHTYAFIGLDQTNPAYGKVQWTVGKTQADDIIDVEKNLLDAPFKRGDGEGTALLTLPIRPDPHATIIFPNQTRYLDVSKAEEAGDGTVPKRSGAIVKDHAKGYFELLRVEHEPAYKNKNAHAQCAALYGIVKIAQRIDEIKRMSYK
ncbi:hypothetical protein BH11PSE12_BH11PSE12_32840 [soil metagenome]